MSTRNLITPGDVFGRLTILSEAPRRSSHRYWVCQCSCGSAPKQIGQSNLFRITRSCGCLAKESRELYSKLRITHGKTKTPEYKIWEGIRSRCSNKNVHNYDKYKDRAPVESWEDFEVFLRDMGLRPSPNHSIERVKNDLPYGPENCVWATAKEQSRNRPGFNVNIEYQGRTQCIAAWAEEFKIKRTTLDYRLKAGWSIEKALTTK